MRALQLKGKIFGRLTVLQKSPLRKSGHTAWVCLCNCGNKLTVVGSALVCGNTKSCGCFHKDQTAKAKTTHGHTRYGRWTPEYHLWSAAKFRAEKQGVEFSIDLADVVIPEICPLLGTKIKNGIGKWNANSPTLDRIKPLLGYIPGNTWVISHHANTIKNDATLEELRLIVKGLEKVYG